MALRILAWDDVANRIKRTASDPSAVGTPTRAQRVSLLEGTTSVAVLFSSSMPSANYAVTCTLQNTVDEDPQLQPLVVTAQDADGFVVEWNAPLSSDNYVLNYQAIAFM